MRCGDILIDRQFYADNGYVIIPGLLSRPLCEIAIDIAFAYAERPEYPPLYMPHRGIDFFLSLMRMPDMVDAVETVLGCPASGLGSEYFFHKPGTMGFSVHQDNLFVQAPTGKFLHAWCALVDVGPDNGGLVFWPRTHKLGLLPVREIHENAGAGQNPGARQVAVDIPPGYDPELIKVSRGDVIIWDSEMIHASRQNESDGFRHAVLFSYIAKGAPFNAGRKQKRVEVALR